MNVEERRAVVVDWLRRNPLGVVMETWVQLAWEDFLGPAPPEQDRMNLHGSIQRGGSPP